MVEQPCVPPVRHDDRQVTQDLTDWAVPGQFTVVDAYLLVFWLRGRRIGLDMEADWPSWALLMSRLLARPAVQRTMQQEGIGGSGFSDGR